MVPENSLPYVQHGTSSEKWVNDGWDVLSPVFFFCFVQKKILSRNYDELIIEARNVENKCKFTHQMIVYSAK